jgi:glycosyltransferase involved in cell wall biosynthesis
MASCTFLMMARLLYEKGYSQYVAAAKAVRQVHPEARFQLLGAIDVEFPNAVPLSVVEADSHAGYIEYLGFQKDVRSFILVADCVVLPSFYNEGLSRVLMEALALKKPIITTDIPGCKETVEDGVNGFLCRPKDVDSLVDAVHRFMALTAEERLAMGLAGRRKAETQFDIKRVIEVYRSITARLEKR